MRFNAFAIFLNHFSTGLLACPLDSSQCALSSPSSRGQPSIFHSCSLFLPHFVYLFISVATGLLAFLGWYVRGQCFEISSLKHLISLCILGKYRIPQLKSFLNMVLNSFEGIVQLCFSFQLLL